MECWAVTILKNEIEYFWVKYSPRISVDTKRHYLNGIEFTAITTKSFINNSSIKRFEVSIDHQLQHSTRETNFGRASVVKRMQNKTGKEL